MNKHAKLNPSIKTESITLIHKQTHHLGVLCRHAVSILNQCLKLVVFGESDYFQHSSKLREDLWMKSA